MAIRTTTTDPSPPPQQTRPPRSRGLLITLLLSLVVAGVAVAGIVAVQRDDKATTGTVITDGSIGTTAPALSQEQKITNAYKGYVAAVIRANDPPNPNDPLLEVYASGPQLEAARAAIVQKMKDGVVVRTAANTVSETRWVKVLSISGDTATVSACNISDGGVVNAVTGAPVGPQGVTTLAVNATLAQDASGAWRVSTIAFGPQWQGVAGCATSGP